MVKCLALMKASNWEYLMVKQLALKLEQLMESHLGLMLDQSWDLKMDCLMVLMVASFDDYFLEAQWDLFIINCLALMKA